MPTYAPSTQAQELTQELEACTSKIATKMNRDERSAAALATARAGLRCAAALEGDQLDAGPCALLEAAVVRAAASGVRGAPSREKLAGRFKHRVEGPARAWLLVPDHADGVLGHAFAAAADTSKISTESPSVECCAARRCARTADGFASTPWNWPKPVQATRIVA